MRELYNLIALSRASKKSKNAGKKTGGKHEDVDHDSEEAKSTKIQVRYYVHMCHLLPLGFSWSLTIAATIILHKLLCSRLLEQLCYEV